MRAALLVLGLLAGCTQAPSALDAPATLSVSSPAFAQGQPIPRAFTCQGANGSPALAFGGVPPEARGLALLMDDPDATRGTFTHWVFWNLPTSVATLPQGASIAGLGGVEGANGAGQLGYRGPCPPTGNHRYFFKLYAQREPLSLEAGAPLDQFVASLQGKLLAKGELMGTYQRS